MKGNKFNDKEIVSVICEKKCFSVLMMNRSSPRKEYLTPLISLWQINCLQTSVTTHRPEIEEKNKYCSEKDNHNLFKKCIIFLGDFLQYSNKHN